MAQFSTYAEMRQQVGKLFGEGRHAKAAEILEWGLHEFPDHLSANVFNLALMRVMLDQPNAAIQAFEFGLERGVWFGPWELGADAWDPIRETESFKTVQSRSESLREEAQSKAKPELTIAPPADFDPAKTYPLFIALHGGGETVEAFKPQWTSPELENEFIVAYPQSSRVISMTGFSWTGEDPDEQEIVDAYQAACRDYNVDTSRVIMGGFSSGGHLTLSLLLAEEPTVPVCGFVVLCPPVPKEYPVEAVARIVDRGQRGVMLTTEMDGRVDDQRKLAEAFQAGGVPLTFEVLPNIGHWYPPDMGRRIDRAIEFILLY
jgi:acetyl esterase/lipase